MPAGTRDRGADEARATSRRWALLAGGIAHDLNNALHTVRARIDLTLRQAPPEVPTHHLEAALLNLEDAQQVAGQLLSLARGEYAEHAHRDLAALARETVERALTDPRIQVVVHIPDEPVVVRFDASRIRQLINNLIRNAVQAMPEGGTLTVALTTVTGGQAEHGLNADRTACLTVSDSGVGIAPDDLARLFDPSFTTKASGTGLGLAVSEHVAHQHAGTLTCQSTRGQGTTFALRLPVARPIA